MKISMVNTLGGGTPRVVAAINEFEAVDQEAL